MDKIHGGIVINQEVKALPQEAPAGAQFKKILEFIHDPRFVQFRTTMETPTIFDVVGRTYTETWHSAVLGWLLNTESNHNLRDFPLQRLILLLVTEDKLEPEERGLDLRRLLTTGDFLSSDAKPNEQDQKERSVVEIGSRFDVFVSGILDAIEPEHRLWKEINIVIETKVKAKISKAQCAKYIAWFNNRREQAKILTLPVFIAPTSSFEDGKGSQELFGDNSWIGFDYQKLYSHVIGPCLQHPHISIFGKYVLSEFVSALKFRYSNKRPLIMSNPDKELAREIWEKHQDALTALSSLLRDDPGIKVPVLEPPTAETKEAIKIKIGDAPFEAISIKKLYLEVLKFLDSHGYLDKLALPIETGGSKQYLLATEPKHKAGNDFWNPVEYKGTAGQRYFMEANKSRSGGLKDLRKVLNECGLTMEEIH